MLQWSKGLGRVVCGGADDSGSIADADADADVDGKKTIETLGPLPPTLTMQAPISPFLFLWFIIILCMCMYCMPQL